MDQYEATFEIESTSDARAVERMVTQLYDSVREESRTVREQSGDSTAVLDQFEAIREVARDPAPGRLTVVYERRDEPFDE